MKNKNETWLIISHAFNMDGRAASQTITDKIPHLTTSGITPIVISARSGRKDKQLEHYRLFPLGPVGLRFDLRHTLQQRLGKGLRYRAAILLASTLLLPGIVVEKLIWQLESQWSWWWPAYRKGLKLIREGRIDRIYSTGGAYAAHVAAAKLKQKTGLPWVAEIHDPLVMPGTEPRSSQERMLAKVENLICQGADLPFWFTEQALASAKKRHPELKDKGKMLLPGANPPATNLPDYQPGKVMVIGHFGSLSPARNLSGIIESISELIDSDSTVQDHLELHIYGTKLDQITIRAIQAFGDRVKVKDFGRLERDPKTGKSGRQQVLERMRTSDILLLQHGVEPFCEEYIPSKVYEYLWMRRPILALVHRNPQLQSMLTELGHIVIPADDRTSQIQAIADLYQRWQSSGLADRIDDSPYTTKAAVEQLCAFVNEI